MVWPSWDIPWHTLRLTTSTPYTNGFSLRASCFFRSTSRRRFTQCFATRHLPISIDRHHAVRPTLRPVESQTTGSMVAMGKARRHPHGDRWTPMWDMVSVSTTLAWRTRRITFFTKWKPPRESHLGTPPIEDTGGATSPSSELTTPLLHPSYD